MLHNEKASHSGGFLLSRIRVEPGRGAYSLLELDSVEEALLSVGLLSVVDLPSSLDLAPVERLVPEGER